MTAINISLKIIEIPLEAALKATAIDSFPIEYLHIFTSWKLVQEKTLQTKGNQIKY